MVKKPKSKQSIDALENALELRGLWCLSVLRDRMQAFSLLKSMSLLLCANVTFF